MDLFARVTPRKILAICALLMLPLFTSCNSVYTTKHFSFPPGSKPHENNWTYTGLVIVSSSQSPITKKSDKNIKIRIYDKNKIIYLNDDLEFNSASVRANIFWDTFEELRIELFEVGNEYAKDSYNQDLLRTGPNRLFELMYQYDNESKRFKRVK